MNQKDNIVVFEHFENPIEANIVKTKLDAYGIPCFLTEENFSNLYPSNHLITGGIRLHVFEQDEERARSLLLERNPPEDITDNCPRCSSSRIKHEESTKLESGSLLSFINNLFSNILFPSKKINRCEDCHFEF